MKLITTLIINGYSGYNSFIPSEETNFLFHKNGRGKLKNKGAFGRGIRVMGDSILLNSKKERGLLEKGTPLSRNMKVNGANWQSKGAHGQSVECFVASMDVNGASKGVNGQSTDAHGDILDAHVNVSVAHGQVFAC